MFQKKGGINGLGGGGIGGLKKTILKPKPSGIGGLMQKKPALPVQSTEKGDDQPENQNPESSQAERQLPTASVVEEEQEDEDDTIKDQSGGGIGGLKKGAGSFGGGGIGGLKKTILKPKSGGIGGLMQKKATLPV